MKLMSLPWAQREQESEEWAMRTDRMINPVVRRNQSARTNKCNKNILNDWVRIAKRKCRPKSKKQKTSTNHSFHSWKSLNERDHKVAGHLNCMGCPAKKIVPPSQGVPGANSDRWHSLPLARNTPKEWFFWTKEAERGWKSGARPLSRKSNLKSSTKQEFWRQRI